MWKTRDAQCYKKLEQIGEGTYGQVFVAVDIFTKELVAMKKIQLPRQIDGFPITALREIKILKSFKHPNIVELKEIATSKAENGIGDDVYLVFEYVDTDLSGLMDMAREGGIPWFNETQIKCYMYQLLQALKFVHDHNIIHRDLKSSNILITEFNEVKLADFGLSRQMGLERDYTNNVITRWYRPPELLLGCTKYKNSIDMWSIGCILAELLIGRSPFIAESDNDELYLILSICGTPTRESWAAAYSYSRKALLDEIKPHERRLQNHLYRIARDKHGPSFKLPDEAWDLIDKLLVINPDNRLNADQALSHPWFKEVIDPHLLPRLPVQLSGDHEFQTKKRKIM